MDSIQLTITEWSKEMTDAVQIRRPTSILDEMKDMQERIMRRAHEIFQQNGSMLGRDIENWTQAERELMWKPAFELSEKDGRFQLEAAVSGIDPKDIEVEVTPEDIVVKAETHHKHTEQKGTIHNCEFHYGKMFRAIHLPKKIDPAKVKAEFKNGLLRLTAEIAQADRSKTGRSEAA
jgi:HSP20 family molecular chaperone IbpA